MLTETKECLSSQEPDEETQSKVSQKTEKKTKLNMCKKIVVAQKRIVLENIKNKKANKEKKLKLNKKAHIASRNK